jgi:hypothetical protein
MPQSRPWCRITLRGSFDVQWADYIEALMVDLQVTEGEVQTTTLLGHPIDLTAFLGAINTLVDLHFPVTACEYHQAEPIDAEVGSSGERVSHEHQPYQNSQ